MHHDTIPHADAAPAWNDLHARFEMKRIDHQQAFGLDGACTNWVESNFNRLRRGEMGTFTTTQVRTCCVIRRRRHDVRTTAASPTAIGCGGSRRWRWARSRQWISAGAGGNMRSRQFIEVQYWINQTISAILASQHQWRGLCVAMPSERKQVRPPSVQASRRLPRQTTMQLRWGYGHSLPSFRSGDSHMERPARFSVNLENQHTTIGRTAKLAMSSTEWIWQHALVTSLEYSKHLRLFTRNPNLRTLGFADRTILLAANQHLIGCWLAK